MFRDRDYILTPEKFFFCVVGYTHPPDRVVAYLKYAPEKTADGKGGTGFRRVLPYYTIPCLEETLAYLQKNHPSYVHYDRKSKIRFSAVPLARIRTHFYPERRLHQLFSTGAKDRLESKLLEFISMLAARSDIPSKFFGVTGSILIKLHNPEFSDMDITVHGRSNSLKVKSTLLTLYKSENVGVERFKGSLLREWCTSKTKLYPLSLAEAEDLYRRIWNRGTYRGTMFSIHPTRLKQEVDERYGDRIFLPKGIVEVEATVKRSEDSFFTPCVYPVEGVDFKSGLKVDDLSEVVSYEGLYRGIFNEGERIVSRGILEKVRDRCSGKTYHRVLVGSLKAGGKDYINPV